MSGAGQIKTEDENVRGDNEARLSLEDSSVLKEMLHELKMIVEQLKILTGEESC